MTKIQINNVVRDMTAEEQAEFDARQVTPPTAFEQSMINLRAERNKLLQECDWRVTKAADTGVALSNDWKTYRQQLRDLPSTQNPIISDMEDDNIGISSVTWPTKPS